MRRPLFARHPIGKVHLVQRVLGPPAQLTLCGRLVEGYTVSDDHPGGAVCGACSRVATADATESTAAPPGN